MKLFRVAALFLASVQCLLLCSCRSSRSSDPYSETISYASRAQDRADLVCGDGNFLLKNRTAALLLPSDASDTLSLGSQQTGETLMKHTFSSYLTAPDCSSAPLTGISATGSREVYSASLSQSLALRIPADPSAAQSAVSFSLTRERDRAALSALAYHISSEGTDSGLRFTSTASEYAQFGARDLSVVLPEADRWYLSLTLRVSGVQALECYFSTDSVPLTRSMLFAEVDLTSVGAEDFVTLTVPFSHRSWCGVLQTLLFRFQGEGTVELSELSVRALLDPVIEDCASRQWHFFGDRIYFSQQASLPEGLPYRDFVTEIRFDSNICVSVEETDSFAAVCLIDGTVFGAVRPAGGGVLSVERTSEGILFRLISPAEPGGEGFSLYLEYTEDFSTLASCADRERSPLSAEDLSLSGAAFLGYDSRTGVYRIAPEGDSVSLSVPGGPFYFALEGDSPWLFYDENEQLLPLASSSVFPSVFGNAPRRMILHRQAAVLEEDSLPFFGRGFLETGHASTVLDGLCRQYVSSYLRSGTDCSVSVTATHLEGGSCTIYDLVYTFTRDSTVSDLSSFFPLFSFGLEYGFDRYFYLNGEDLPVSASAGEEDRIYLGSMPYLALLGDSEEQGWIISRSEMTVGGRSEAALLTLRYREADEEQQNRLELLYDRGETIFLRGDTLSLQLVCFNGSDPSGTLPSLRSAGNFRQIQEADRSERIVRVSGLEDTVILRLGGFSDYTFPELYRDGERFFPEYRVIAESNGTYSFAFSLPNGSELKIGR